MQLQGQVTKNPQAKDNPHPQTITLELQMLGEISSFLLITVFHGNALKSSRVRD